MTAGMFSNPPWMEQRRTWSVLVVALAFAMGLAPVQADAKGNRRTVTKQYVSGAGGYWMSTGVCSEETDTHVGIVCLGYVDDGYVNLRIDDRTGARVGGYVVITDGNGTILYSHQFCQSSGPIALQDGVLFVYLDGPKNTYDLGCPLGEPGFATVGQVHATFTNSSRAQRGTLRSGRIVGGLFTTGPAGMCNDVPDCATWLRRDCDPALAGRDPAWLASIVDVADLADGKVRTFGYGPARPAGVAPGGVTVEFWSEDCHEVGGFKRIWIPGGDWRFVYEDLRIPVGAKWMTVTGNDKLNAAWTLEGPIS